MLDSVLSQTYDNIEFIFVNDASTDNTEEIILSYKEKFKNNGIDFIYIKLALNKGQSGAINEGLKIFTGKYLTWPDSDDILYENYISEKVSFMEANPQYALCFSQCDMADENDTDKITGVLQRIPPKENEIDNLFEDLIYGRNAVYAPIASFITKEAFLSVIPGRKIYENKGGQNWQMLLPAAYQYKAGYINKKLARYIVRASSHSRNKNKLLLLKNHEDILRNTITAMDMPEIEKKRYLKEIRLLYIKKRLIAITPNIILNICGKVKAYVKNKK